MYDYRFRYQYDKEDELKQLVKEHHIPDSNIVSQSEEEEEEQESESDDETLFEEAPPTEAQAGEEDALQEPAAQRIVPQQQHPSLQSAVAEEQKVPAERAESKESKLAAKRKSGSASPPKPARRFNPVEEAMQTLHKRVDGKKHATAAGRPHGLARSVDESQRKALLARQRRLLKQLLRAQAPTFHPMKKLTHDHAPPPEYDANGDRVWWVRRHLVGPYGPILAVRPPSTNNAPRDTWEHTLEQEDD
jgi:hypothetical protein